MIYTVHARRPSAAGALHPTPCCACFKACLTSFLDYDASWVHTTLQYALCAVLVSSLHGRQEMAAACAKQAGRQRSAWARAS